MTRSPKRSLPLRNASFTARKLRLLRRLGRPPAIRIVTWAGVRRGCFRGRCGTPGRAPFGFRPAPLRFPPQLRNLIASCFMSVPFHRASTDLDDATLAEGSDIRGHKFRPSFESADIETRDIHQTSWGDDPRVESTYETVLRGDASARESELPSGSWIG